MYLWVIQKICFHGGDNGLINFFNLINSLDMNMNSMLDSRCRSRSRFFLYKKLLFSNFLTMTNVGTYIGSKIWL